MKKLSGNGKIYEEIQVGSMRVPNRIVVAPFCTRLADPDGFVTPELIDYWRERAAGGAGMVIVEATSIDQKCSRLERNQLGAFGDDCYVGLARIAEAIQTHGAKAVLQLCHAGRQTMPPAIWGQTPLAPSAIPCPYMSRLIGEPNPTREITIEEMREVQENFVEACWRAKQAGFDGVEMHFAHGYLVGSFLSSYMNKRQDEYGGSLENKARYPIEIIKSCLKRVGAGFIGVRITADEYIDGGISLDESKTVSKWFEEAGVSYIHVSASNYETVETQCPTVYQAKGFLIHLADAIKKEIKIPVIAVAAITPDLAVEVIEKDKADMVAIGRGLNADPYFPQKMAEGRTEDIIPCIRCNRCLEAEGQEHPTRCETNFLTGRRLEYPFILLRDSRRVVVVGGGPGGLEAARVAALRGCRVKLYDENDQLGGALIAASVPEFMDDFKRLIVYYEAQLKKLGVEVVLNHRVLPKTIEGDSPDTLVLALGSNPVTTRVPGKDKTKVSQAVDAILGKVSLGNQIILIGGNFISMQIAAHLAQQGKRVFLASRRVKEEQLGGELEAVSQYMLVRMLKELNVELLLRHNLIEITEEGGVFENSKGSSTVKADNVLLSLGYLPRSQDLKKFKGIAQRVYAVGDCVRPRRIGPAIHEGFIAGYDA